jgi:hypothetical protein
MSSTGATAPARQGCLTPEQLAALRDAEPGQAPEDLARHLAGCAACQERLLQDGQPRARRGFRGAVRPPGLRRAFLMLGAVLLAMAAFFYTLSRLSTTLR